MIQRQAGIGTTVISTGAGMGFSYELSSIDDLDQLAKDHQRKILEIRQITCNAKLSSDIGYPIGTKLYCLCNVREGKNSEDPPIVFTYVFFSEKLKAIPELAIKYPQILAVHLVEKATGKMCVEIRQSIHAVEFPSELAEILKVKAKSPALRILRRYLDQSGAPLVISESWHPGHRYAFSIIVRKNNLH